MTTQPRPLGIALIGFGGIGRAHAQAWRDVALHYGLPAGTLRLVGVATARPETAKQAGQALGDVIATSDAGALIGRADVDIVDVCTPGDSHLAMAQLACAARKHLYLEKPVANDLADARRVAAAVRQAGVAAQINFNYRWLPAVQRMKELIAQGFLGELRAASGRYCRSSHADPQRAHSWRHVRARAGGGALADLGAHVLDLLQWLAGPITQVRAATRTVIAQRPTRADGPADGLVDTDDEARAQLRFASGAEGVLETSRIAIGALNELTLELRGSAGALRFNLDDPNAAWAYDATLPEARRGWTRLETVQRYAGAKHPDWASAVGISRSHCEGVYQFARAIWEDRPAEPGLLAGLRAQAAIEAGYASAGTDAWVPVSTFDLEVP
ncbi:MAG: Gfo/Idh/MocA family oxidoreductase [Thermoflexales bacterium]|nr:Gfo/Idh/MocA family oxidoreductase [Thermoflexales bacterium]